MILNWIRTLCLLGSLIALAGCSTFKSDQAALNSYWVSGNYHTAAGFTEQKLKTSPERDKLLWMLEAGTAQRAVGKTAESVVTFENAYQLMREYDDGPVLRIGDQLGSLATNLSTVPYTGTQYDRIMLNTFQALNYLQLGQPDRARVELNRALERQREAVRANADRIEKARDEARELDAKKDEEMAKAGARSSSINPQSLQQQLELKTPGMEAYADFVNPFTTYLDGLYFSRFGTSGSDLERARVSFQRVMDMGRQSRYLQQDLADLKTWVQGSPTAPTVYLIIAQGMSPQRAENRIDLPLFIVSDSVPYFGVNFPKLNLQPAPARQFRVQTSNWQGETELLASMDNVITQEFNQELPVTITRTLIAATTKALLQRGVQEATRDAGFMGTLLQVGAAIYQYGMNEADLRSWISLPKEFLYARFPTPSDKTIRLQMGGISSGPQLSQFELPADGSYLIYVRIPSSYSQPLISIIPLP